MTQSIKKAKMYLNGEFIAEVEGVEVKLNEPDPHDEFDKWVAAKPSYFTEEHRQSFLAGWEAARREK